MQMTSAFPSSAAVGDEASGVLTVHRERDVWLIQARFPLLEGDHESDSLRSRCGEPTLQFSYRYTGPLAVSTVMNELQALVLMLHAKDSRAYERAGLSFDGRVSLACALDPLASLGYSIYVSLFGLGMGSALELAQVALRYSSIGSGMD